MSRERDRAHRRRTKPAMPGAVVGGRRAVTEAIRAGRATEVLMVSSPKVTQGMRALLEAAEREGVRVTVTPRARLDAMTDDHQGVVARLEPSRDEGSSRSCPSVTSPAIRSPTMPSWSSSTASPTPRTWARRRAQPKPQVRRCSSRASSEPPTSRRAR